MINNWVTLSLNDVANIIGGGTPNTSNENYWNGKIPWITPRDLSESNSKYISKGERNISELGLSNSSARLLPKGAVLLSSRAPVGYLAIGKDNLATNQGFRSLIPNEQSCSEFLFYLLKNNIEYLRSQASGSTFLEISGSVLGSLVFNFPPLPEQKAIAGVLSALDDKIDLLHRQNETLEALAQTLFRQWFIEQAQDDWKDIPLGEIINIFDNQRVPLSKMQRDRMKTGILYPYYGAAKIMDYINDYIFDGEYILMGEDGTVITDDGYPVLQYAKGKFWVNNHTHVLQAKKPYTNFLILCFLRQKRIDSIVTGAVQPKINQANLKSISFPDAPIKIINRFINFTNDIHKKILNNFEQITTIENVRDMLLPRLISGQVRVRYDQAE